MPGPEVGGSWGILGGTFDPVHRGHLMLATEIAAARGLAGVLFVPAWRHPFKGEAEVAPYAHRVAMLELAVAPAEGLMVSTIEAEQELSGYTIDTVRALKEQYRETKFYFLIGADNLDQMGKWRDPHRLLEETSILAGARPGYTFQPDRELPLDRIELVETHTIDISSTELRAALARGGAREILRQWLPEAVLAYIEKEHLYR